MRRFVTATAIALILATPAYSKGRHQQPSPDLFTNSMEAYTKQQTANAAKASAEANAKNFETLQKMGPVGTSADPHTDLVSWATGGAPDAVRKSMMLFMAVLPPILDILAGIAAVEICLAVQEANAEDEEEERKRREEAQKKGAVPLTPAGGKGEKPRLEPTFGNEKPKPLPTPTHDAPAMLSKAPESDKGKEGKEPKQDQEPHQKSNEARTGVAGVFGSDSRLPWSSKPVKPLEGSEDDAEGTPMPRPNAGQGFKKWAAEKASGARQKTADALDKAAHKIGPVPKKTPNRKPTGGEIKEILTATDMKQQELADFIKEEVRKIDDTESCSIHTVQGWVQGKRDPDPIYWPIIWQLYDEHVLNGEKPKASKGAKDHFKDHPFASLD